MKGGDGIGLNPGQDLDPLPSPVSTESTVEPDSRVSVSLLPAALVAVWASRINWGTPPGANKSGQEARYS